MCQGVSVSIIAPVTMTVRLLEHLQGCCTITHICVPGLSSGDLITNFHIQSRGGNKAQQVLYIFLHWVTAGLSARTTIVFGAGRENRTLIFSLEGCNNPFILYPQCCFYSVPTHCSTFYSAGKFIHPRHNFKFFYVIVQMISLLCFFSCT